MKALLCLLALASTLHAELHPLLPDGKARPYRARVLLLGDALRESVARAAQERLRDTSTLYRSAAALSSTAQVLDLVRAEAGAEIVRGDWDALCLALPDAVEADRPAVERALAKSARTVVWATREELADPRALASNLERALLQRSTPWAALPRGEPRDPARLLEGEALLDEPDRLPVVPAKTATVFRAEAGQWQFNLHSFIAHHAGKFWAIWSSGRVDEDSSSQFIRSATSADGLTWSLPSVVAGDPDGEDGPQRWLASGLYVENGTLYALGCLNAGDRDGRIWADAKLIRLKWTDDGWKDDTIVAENCMVYYPPLKVAGRDFFVWRDEFAHFFTARSTPQPGPWEVKKHPNYPPDYRLSETSAYADAAGTLHLIIRDQGKTKRLYHSLSFDQGETWTLPVKTNYPDAVSKNFAGRLQDGTFFLINNPKPSGLRDPLTISFSRDGWSFGNPKVLRRDSPARRYPGKAKVDHSFQYADALEHSGRLHVIYAVNKEDIEISSYDLAELLR